MQSVLLVLLLLSTVLLGGCQLVADVFQAGMAVGVILVVLIIAGVIFVARKVF